MTMGEWMNSGRADPSDLASYNKFMLELHTHEEHIKFLREQRKAIVVNMQERALKIDCDK